MTTDLIQARPGPVLSIGGREFPIRAVDLTWHMMVLARASDAANVEVPPLDQDAPLNVRAEIEKRQAAKEKAGSKLMGTMYAIVMKILADDVVRQDFEEFMDEAELDQGSFDEALSNALQTIAGGGDGDPSKAGGPSSSSESSPTTPASSPVDSYALGSVPATIPGVV
jgi:hypothetical protein